jgi:hypothetical protein
LNLQVTLQHGCLLDSFPLL